MDRQADTQKIDECVSSYSCAFSCYNPDLDLQCLYIHRKRLKTILTLFSGKLTPSFLLISGCLYFSIPSFLSSIPSIYCPSIRHKYIHLEGNIIIIIWNFKSERHKEKCLFYSKLVFFHHY